MEKLYVEKRDGGRGVAEQDFRAPSVILIGGEGDMGEVAIAVFCKLRNG